MVVERTQGVSSVALPYSITPEGDAALVIRFGQTAGSELVGLVHAAAVRLASADIAGVTDIVPAYCTLTVCYDPIELTYAELCAQVGLRLHGVTARAAERGRLVEVPVCYEGELAPDLADLAAHARMTSEEVVRTHAAGTYLVCMLGFLPGFPYLSGLDPRLACPRLEVPRTEVPTGSVGIGGAQTGVYPMASPGGWRLIGRTPACLYDPDRAEPIPYRPGDRLRFRAIGRSEYEDLLGRARQGERVTRVIEGA